ncbi:hypothetical protein C1H46_044569 [Malus baccata]|uniref:Uncharacterized protein n=1 Tax=Malus baccata TaxID=106549 RepID=A0A540K6Q3_MALBA|nr:hypothetical protein C1H46_044569 [Malus baccata]
MEDGWMSFWIFRRELGGWVVRQGVGMVYGGGEWCRDVWNGAGMDEGCCKRWFWVMDEFLSMEM